MKISLKALHVRVVYLNDTFNDALIELVNKILELHMTNPNFIAKVAKHWTDERVGAHYIDIVIDEKE